MKEKNIGTKILGKCREFEGSMKRSTGFTPPGF
jgi:hypothetical protein